MSEDFFPPPSGPRYDGPEATPAPDDQIKRLLAERNELGENLGLKQPDYAALDDFSLAKDNQELLQRAGKDTLGAEDNISAAVRRMTPEAQGIASKWHRYNQQIEAQRNRQESEQ